MKHLVEYDDGGIGKPRITCRTCDVTLKKDNQSDELWVEVVIEFTGKHPSLLDNEILEMAKIKKPVA